MPAVGWLGGCFKRLGGAGKGGSRVLPFIVLPRDQSGDWGLIGV